MGPMPPETIVLSGASHAAVRRVLDVGAGCVAAAANRAIESPAQAPVAQARPAAQQAMVPQQAPAAPAGASVGSTAPEAAPAGPGRRLQGGVATPCATRSAATRAAQRGIRMS